MKGVLRVASPTGPPPAPSPGTVTAAGAAAAPPPPQPVREGGGPATQTVNIVEPSLSDAMGWGFNPKVVDVRAGDTVVWRNTGTMAHTVTADAFDSPVDPGKTFSRLFDTPGVYAYHCTPHPWMKGIVRVSNAEGGAAPAIPADIESAGPGGSGHSAADSASSPLHLLARVTHHGSAAAKLGWILLMLATAVGFTILLGWAWEYPTPTAVRSAS
jgi:plastocyanin